MLKNIIILVVIIIGGYMVYTNYMQNEEIAALDGVGKKSVIFYILGE